MGDEYDDNYDDDDYGDDGGDDYGDDGGDGGDSYTETSSEGLGERLMNSIKSVGIGILLFIISFPVLWCNEGTAVKVAKGLSEGAGTVKHVDANKVDSSMNGKLIHITADAKTEDMVTDTQLGVSEKAIKLMRSVEMYQWKEHKKTKTKKKIGGRKVKKTTYSYRKGWSSTFNDSSRFKRRKYRGRNPQMRYKSKSWAARNVTAGAFKLTSALIGSISKGEPLQISQDVIDKLPADIKDKAKIDGEYLFIGEGSSSSPQVGDYRIKYSIVKPQVVSIIGKQNGSTFEPYYTEQKTKILMLTTGTVSAKNMFVAAQEANKTKTWIMRLIGFLMMAIGLGMVFQPIATLADVLPFLGDILRLGIGLFAGVVAFALSFVTIAIAWIFYRPLLGIGLLVLGVGAIVGFKMLGKGKK